MAKTPGNSKGTRRACERCGRTVFVDITERGEPMHEGKPFCDECLTRLEE